MKIPPRLELRETADTLAALPRFWVHSLGRQRTTDERIISRPNTQPGLPSNHHLWKLPRSGPSPRRSAARCARIIIFVQEVAGPPDTWSRRGPPHPFVSSSANEFGLDQLDRARGGRAELADGGGR